MYPYPVGSTEVMRLRFIVANPLLPATGTPRRAVLRGAVAAMWSYCMSQSGPGRKAEPSRPAPAPPFAHSGRPPPPERKRRSVVLPCLYGRLFPVTIVMAKPK